MTRLKDHDLWPVLQPYGAFLGSERMVSPDSFVSRGGVYLLGFDVEGEPYVYHFNTFFFPRTGRFRFSSDELSFSLGKLSSFPLDLVAGEGHPLALRSYSLYLSRLGLDGPGIPHMDEPLLRIFLRGQGEVVPNLWYQDPAAYFGYLVAENSLGQFCLVQVAFSQGSGDEAVVPLLAKDFLGRGVLFPKRR